MGTQRHRQRRAIAERIREFCLMDDEFMTTFFDGQTECTEYVLRIILGKSDLRVVSAQSQWHIPNLHGRGGRLDVKATDSAGRLYDIEVQRADRGAGAKRARLNVGLMDTRTLLPGQDSEALPELYVIFITEHDVLGGGRAVYRIERVIMGTEVADGAGGVAVDGCIPFNDMAHIVYVNGAYRGRSPVGDLMHDFSCRQPDDMRSAVLAARAKYLKGNEQEVRKMSYIVEELIREAQEDARADRDIETAAGMLAQGLVTEERLASFFHFTPEQMEEVRELAREGAAVRGTAAL